jgi:hypothetical protein
VAQVSAPPAFDQSSTGQTSGAATYTVSATTAGTNRLLLLAITWKNTTAMSTVPTGGPGGWTSVAAIDTGGTHRTEVFRAFASSQLTASTITITVPGGVKSSAVLASFSATDTSGTNGSGAIDKFETDTNTSANPSLSITPVSGGMYTLVVGVLGAGDGTAPTAGTGFTLRNSIASSGGTGTAKTQTAFETANSPSSGGSAVAVPFTRASIDWTQINIVIKGP